MVSTASPAARTGAGFLHLHRLLGCWLAAGAVGGTGTLAGPALLWAVAAIAGGMWLLIAGEAGADERAGAVLLLLGLGVVYVVLLGIVVTWVCLKSLGWLIREAFEECARMRAVAILGAPVAFLRSEDREPLDAWRSDLAALSERPRGSWLLDRPCGVDSPRRLLALVAVPFVFAVVLDGAGLLNRIHPVMVPSLAFLAIMSGLAFVLAARLIRRANDDLYQSTLQGAISDLAVRFGETAVGGGRFGIPVVTVIARAGLVLICVGVAAVALGYLL